MIMIDGNSDGYRDRLFKTVNFTVGFEDSILLQQSA